MGDTYGKLLDIEAQIEKIVKWAKSEGNRASDLMKQNEKLYNELIAERQLNSLLKAEIKNLKGFINQAIHES